ncbi:DUF4031 domain-containing protein [Nonomuraea dietziae]|uniref:DUF4031 domain-containing protein n=1 Tax=Nonomuraea dietziae TaxID=65515 RepID=UPI0031E15B2A
MRRRCSIRQLARAQGLLWSHHTGQTDTVTSRTLHARFAALRGCGEQAYDRDHYDVARDRSTSRAVALGAEPVSSRELLSRLSDRGPVCAAAGVANPPLADPRLRGARGQGRAAVTSAWGRGWWRRGRCPLRGDEAAVRSWPRVAPMELTIRWG